VGVPRPREPLLSRERIVEEATRLIDAEGLAAASTRRIARELGVQSPSLYNHFRTKEDLLDAVADAIMAQVDTTVFGEHPWPEALKGWARSYRAALAAHPNIVPHLAQGPGRRPAALAMADAVYGALVDGGWPRGEATRIGAMMRYFVVGSSLGSFAQGFINDARVYADHYPHLDQAHLLREHREEIDSGAFELGLDALIDGLARRFEEVRAGLAPR
jgi:AcrR family transcriptional regulator